MIVEVYSSCLHFIGFINSINIDLKASAVSRLLQTTGPIPVLSESVIFTGRKRDGKAQHTNNQQINKIISKHKQWVKGIQGAADSQQLVRNLNYLPK